MASETTLWVVPLTMGLCVDGTTPLTCKIIQQCGHSLPTTGRYTPDEAVRAYVPLHFRPFRGTIL